MKRRKLFPILLAAGSTPHLEFPLPLAQFRRKTALEIAVENCAGLQRPVVVLGCRAAEIRRFVPRGVRVAINRNWRSGQLSSLRAGLRRIPRDAAFLIYPVDLVLLTPRLIHRLVIAYEKRSANEKIIMPRDGRRAGHPVICAPELREELRRARTAREVIYRDRSRIKLVAVKTPAIWEDFDSPASYARVLRTLARRRG